MDKRQIIGILLIILLTISMPYYLKWIQGDKIESMPRNYPDSTGTATDSSYSDLTKEKSSPIFKEVKPVTPIKIEPQKQVQRNTLGIQSDSTKRIIQIESQLIKATISNENGAKLLKWELNKYKHYTGNNVDLITGNIVDNDRIPGLNLDIVNKNGKKLQLNDFTLFTGYSNESFVFLDEDHPIKEVEFFLPVENGKITKKYIFYYDKYSVDVIIKFEGLHNYIGYQWYSLIWENGLHSTEENISDDNRYARAFAYQSGELETLDVSEETEETSPSGRQTDWTAIRTKYFLASIIPNRSKNIDVRLSGEGIKVGANLVKTYSTALEIPFPTNNPIHSDTFSVYLGPIDIDILEPYHVGLENLVMNSGWYENIFRPISRWVILPAFKFLHLFISNYGFVIIIFSILIKFILHPLTKKSYESMSQMQEAQPLMASLREKYKSDPQRLNKEMMKFYKERGINPLGGCLPTILQMPLLFALFIVFRSTIQLRGEPFILWISDLSKPDLLSLGFTLPVVGDAIHVLPFLMGITMIWQSKMTMTDPKQKIMVYMMPVFLIFVFYKLPSGLNLYYAVFNILSMVQTRMIKKRTKGGKGIPQKQLSKNSKLQNTPTSQKLKPARKRKKMH